jgi:hypothetical protein
MSNYQDIASGSRGRIPVSFALRLVATLQPQPAMAVACPIGGCVIDDGCPTNPSAVPEPAAPVASAVAGCPHLHLTVLISMAASLFLGNILIDLIA